MKFHNLVLCAFLLLVAPLFGRDKTDVVVMKNGDRLTGEIKGLNSGVLYLNMDYILGTSSVQWSKVHHVESTQLFIVKTASGSVYTGTLSTSDVQRFNGDINLGAIYSKGNQSTQFNLDSLVQYPRERWSAQGEYSSTLASSTGASPSTRNQVNLQSQRLLRWDNWFYQGIGIFLQSSEQDINLQGTLGGGIGRYFKNTNNAQISLLGGLAWQDTAYQATAEPIPNQNLAAALVAGQMRFFRFNKTSFDLGAIVLPALNQPGRVHVNMNTSYYIKVFSNLTWNISFYGNWDNRPPANFSGSDYGTSTGLGWTFGNR